MASRALAFAVVVQATACDTPGSNTPDRGIGPPQVASVETGQTSPPGEAPVRSPSGIPVPKDGKTVVFDPPLFARRPCTHQGSGKAYEVGPGKEFAGVEDVPWEKLGAGDTVMIHHKKDPYPAKIFVSNSGSAKSPLRVCGVLGPKGERPIIDGERAVARKTPVHVYEPQQDRGVVIVSLDKDDRWGDKPSHVIIEGLEVRNAFRDTPFTGQNGDARKFLPLAAGIFVERGEDIVIRDCLVQGNGNGIFVASANEEATLSRRILIEGNEIRGNGTPGDGFDRRHNVYGEAAGIVYQQNLIGAQRDGAGGSALKDRSIGTVVRYNWIESGARQLDLVEPEEANSLLLGHPSFDEAWVYGNVIVSDERGGTNVVHFGGDLGLDGKERKGPLHFFANTVVVRVDQDKRWRTGLFQLTSNVVRAEMSDNVFFAAPPKGKAPELSLMNESGTLDVGDGNVAGPGILEFPGDRKPKGRVTGGSKITKIDASPFVDVAAANYAPAPGGPLVGKGKGTGSAAFRADAEYVAKCATRPRASKTDVGALSQGAK